VPNITLLNDERSDAFIKEAVPQFQPFL
jgi:hypothetical protein